MMFFSEGEYFLSTVNLPVRRLACLLDLTPGSCVTCPINDEFLTLTQPCHGNRWDGFLCITTGEGLGHVPCIQFLR
jgi:hypothetical protein